jgi:hypothetical protein
MVIVQLDVCHALLGKDEILAATTVMQDLEG